MKKLNIKAFCALLCVALLVGLSSCKKEFDRPPFDEPQSSWIPNMSIATLLMNFDEDQIYVIPDSTYISGYVSGNDVSGNIYKKIFIQDSSAGVELEIDMTNIYTLYPVGQKVVVDLGGLVLGSYGKAPQIGLAGEGTQAARMTEKQCMAHIQKVGFANIKNVSPRMLTIEQINKSGIKYIGMLVAVNNASFVDAGQPFASGGNTNRPMTDGTGSLDLRNSPYSDFSSQKLPAGSGLVVGCLGTFNGGYQLFVRSRDDVFKGVLGPIQMKCVVEGRNIKVSYQPPFGQTPSHYRIYLDGSRKADNVKATEYVLSGIPSGFYTVGVTAVYGEMESAMTIVDNVIVQ